VNDSAVRPTASERRVLVIGATGQVGRVLVAELNNRPDLFEVIAASRSHPNPARQIRLEQPETIERLIASVGPNLVILTAAATNVAWCEEHPEESRVVNVLGTERGALAASGVGASFAFISSDYVFDGRHGPYDENAPTNPINVYGAHKLEAERVVMAANPANLVVRTCQVFGDDPRRTNFVVRVADQLRASKVVEAAGDLFGTPTYAPDLARALVHLAQTGATGIWNVAGDSFLSRYELATMVADAYRCERRMVREVAAGRMHDPVNRPRRSGLLNGRLRAASPGLITALEDALAALAAREEPL
jgi:dTDP-4-dehydrorhamnose reductase